MTEKLYTIQDICQMANVSREAVYNWMANHGLKFVQLPGGRRIPESAWREFIESRTTIRPQEDRLAFGAVRSSRRTAP
jgi:excisionase family DNA binding protein